MRSTVDTAPITYRQFLDGLDPTMPGTFNLDAVVARFDKPTGVTAFDASVAKLVYLVRVPNPRAAGPDRPDAFLYLRVNYNGLEYFNRHAANTLYNPDTLVYLVRREAPPPPPKRRGPLPLPSPNRPQRPRKPIPRVVTPPLNERDDEF